MKLAWLIGVLGMLLTSSGAFCAPTLLQKSLFAVGAVCMLGTSLLEKHRLFAGLQLVALAGALAAFVPVDALLKGGTPLVLCVAVLVWLQRKGEIKEKLSLLGALGLCLLGVGFAVSHPLVYLAGGLALAAYSFLSVRQGVQIALLWGVLNVVFVAAVLWGMLG